MGKRGGKVYLSMADVVGVISGEGTRVNFGVYADATGLGASNCKPEGGPGVQATIGKPQVLTPGGAATPKAAAGRTSVPGGATYTGQLTTWSGTMGWIAPMDTISHPQFKGKIYLKGSDVLSKAGVAEGAILTFSLYTDSQGLGAENCKLADDTGGPEILKPKTKAASVVADADSTVLKAKPKASSIVADADSSVLKAKPKMSADSGSA